MDNEGPVMVTYDPSTISVGEVKTVTATATDSAGNNATCTFLAFGIRDSTGKPFDRFGQFETNIFEGRIVIQSKN